MLEIAPTYQHIPLNTNRRHLVFGDIHGRHTTFLKLLEVASYDSAKDILLSVGDLIDRGPNSAAAVSFFQDNEHCHSIRGNHEQMILNLAYWRSVWLRPSTGGPTTLTSLEKAGKDLPWLQAAVGELPICLDVGEDDDPNAFRLVHAELPFHWSEQGFQSFLDTSDAIEAGESDLLWGRKDIEQAYHCQKTGAEPPCHPMRSNRQTFCGHTPIANILSANSTHWIDTFAGGTLTCVDALTMESWSHAIHKDDIHR